MRAQLVITTSPQRLYSNGPSQQLLTFGEHYFSLSVELFTFLYSPGQLEL